MHVIKQQTSTSNYYRKAQPREKKKSGESGQTPVNRQVVYMPRFTMLCSMTGRGYFSTGVMGLDVVQTMRSRFALTALIQASPFVDLVVRAMQKTKRKIRGNTKQSQGRHEKSYWCNSMSSVRASIKSLLHVGVRIGDKSEKKKAFGSQTWKRTKSPLQREAADQYHQAPMMVTRDATTR